MESLCSLYKQGGGNVLKGFYLWYRSVARTTGTITFTIPVERKMSTIIEKRYDGDTQASYTFPDGSVHYATPLGNVMPDNTPRLQAYGIEHVPGGTVVSWRIISDWGHEHGCVCIEE